jgi:predicted nucleotidyltransferase
MISEEMIRRAVETLKEAGSPSRIILFGSYGRGQPHPDSDLDFLVIQPEVRSRRQEMVRLRRAISPLRIPADVLVVREKTFRKWSDTPGNVLFEATQEGRVVYEAAAIEPLAQANA